MTRFLVAIAFATTSAAANAQSQNVNVTLTEWKVQMTRDTVTAGTVVFQVNNRGNMAHSFHVEGEGIDKGTRDIPARQADALTLTLKAGTYNVYCAMSEGSHKQAGMAKKLVVLPAS
ncbi:MAG: cupredoxin domain-containing protein [Gemmatimonadota bacterium]